MNEEKDKNCSNIIVLPEIKKLKEEIEKLRTELSMILLERDELQLVTCKNIETKYMLNLGSLEYKAYEVQCTVQRLKRKIDLLQAKKNRQEKIIIPEIEQILDMEFAEYQKELNERINKMNEALERSKCPFLSDNENREIKKLYRRIVKKLHPDLNPDVTPEQLQLFNNAVFAYENGDIQSIRIISEMVADDNISITEEDVLSKLTEEKKRLTSAIECIKENIEKIKAEYPYSVKDIVDDPDKIKEKREELKYILKQYNEMVSIYRNKINEMIGE